MAQSEAVVERISLQDNRKRAAKRLPEDRTWTGNTKATPNGVAQVLDMNGRGERI